MPKWSVIVWLDIQFKFRKMTIRLWWESFEWIVSSAIIICNLLFQMQMYKYILWITGYAIYQLRTQSTIIIIVINIISNVKKWVSMLFQRLFHCSIQMILNSFHWLDRIENFINQRVKCFQRAKEIHFYSKLFRKTGNQFTL